MKQLIYVEKKLTSDVPIEKIGDLFTFKDPIIVKVVKWYKDSVIVILENGKVKRVSIEQLWDCKTLEEAISEAIKENQEQK
jgi:hypothetical protein